jgi:hypothetical protein
VAGAAAKNRQHWGIGKQLFLVEALIENRLDSSHRRACVRSINLDFELAALSSPKHHQLDYAARINLLIAVADHDGRLKLLGDLGQYRDSAQMESELIFYFEGRRERIHAPRIKVRAKAVNGAIAKASSKV